MMNFKDFLKKNFNLKLIKNFIETNLEKSEMLKFQQPIRPNTVLQPAILPTREVCRLTTNISNTW